MPGAHFNLADLETRLAMVHRPWSILFVPRKKAHAMRPNIE
jgi:hypothetical protein